MASKGYMYVLVRYNSLLRAREWGLQVPDSLLSLDIPDDSQLDESLKSWNSTGYLPFEDSRDKDGLGNYRGEVPSRTMDSIRLIYVRARDDGLKERSIGIKDLEEFVDGFRTTVLILDGKLSHDATIMTYQSFPYVYKFSDFVMMDSIYNSPSYPISDAVLYDLSQSARGVPQEQIVPIQHRDLPLYVPRDNVPFLRFMKSEKMIFETIRQSTIPGSYDMINYRYVDENYRMTVDELNKRDEEREERRQMREYEKKTVGRKKGKKDVSSFVPSFSSSSSGPDYTRQESLQRIIDNDYFF